MAPQAARASEERASSVLDLVTSPFSSGLVMPEISRLQLRSLRLEKSKNSFKRGVLGSPTSSISPLAEPLTKSAKSSRHQNSPRPRRSLSGQIDSNVTPLRLCFSLYCWYSVLHNDFICWTASPYNMGLMARMNRRIHSTSSLEKPAVAPGVAE